MPDLKTEILSRIDSKRDHIIELCRQLVQINTVNPYSGDPAPGDEAAGQDFIRQQLDPLGPHLVSFDCPDNIYQQSGVIGPEGRSFRGRPNLVAEFEFGDGPQVVLNAHIDTVDTVGMTIEPFAAEVRDGKIWGRGTSDDKSGHAVAIAVLEVLSDLADELRGSIIYESVVDEECNGSGAGTLACIAAGYVGDEAIILDGEGLVILHGCGGCLTASVMVEGKAGHAAMPGAVNAIDKAVFIKEAIDTFKAQRERANPGNRLNLGVFRSGTLPAVVPGSAEMQLNMVYSVEEAAQAEKTIGEWSGKAIRTEFEHRIAARARQDEWLRDHPPEVEWVKDLLPYRLEPDHPLVAGLASAYREIMGCDATLECMDAWGDAAWTSRIARMPTVMFAPGEPGKEHSADEFVRIENLVHAARILALYLYRRLGVQ